MKEDNISQLGDYDGPFCEQQYTHGSCYISLFKFKSFDQFKTPQTASDFRHLLSCGIIGSADFFAITSTSDLDKYADFILSAISIAVNKAIPKSKSVRSESNPISGETIALINPFFIKRGVEPTPQRFFFDNF